MEMSDCVEWNIGDYIIRSVLIYKLIPKSQNRPYNSIEYSLTPKLKYLNRIPEYIFRAFGIGFYNSLIVLKATNIV